MYWSNPKAGNLEVKERGCIHGVKASPHSTSSLGQWLERCHCTRMLVHAALSRKGLVVEPTHVLVPDTVY